MTGDNYNGRLLLLSLRTITVMRRELINAAEIIKD